MNIIKEVRKELKKHYDREYQEGAHKFFKEQVKIFGVRAKVVRKISADFYKREINQLEKKEIFTLVEEFLKTEFLEEATVGLDWLDKTKKRFEKSDFKLFESWLKKYVHNWATCDDICTHPFGYLLTQHPGLFSKVKVWGKSKNMWLRRASAVILIHPIKKKKMLKEVFVIAEILLEDKEDLVQKGYGWMLKEASNTFPDEVFDFVMNHKAKMPRTALRYAIEKYPQESRKKAMAR